MWWERGILVVWWFRGLRGVVPRPGSGQLPCLLCCFSMCMEGAPDSPRCVLAAREPVESREQPAPRRWWRQHRPKEGTHDFLLTSLMPLHLTWQVCGEETVCESIWRGSVTQQRAGRAPSHRSPPNQFARGSPVGHLPVQTGKGTVKWEGNYAGKSGDPLSRTWGSAFSCLASAALGGVSTPSPAQPRTLSVLLTFREAEQNGATQKSISLELTSGVSAATVIILRAISENPNCQH